MSNNGATENRRFTWPAPRVGRLLSFATASRIFVVIVGMNFAAIGLSPSQQALVSPYSLRPTDLPTSKFSVVEAWYRFDAKHHLRVAIEGYGGEGNEMLFAFLPMLPLMMRGVGACGGDVHVAGLLFPNLAFIIGLVAFGRAIWKLTEDSAAVWKACILLTAFPTAFFFSAPYQESLAFMGVSLGLFAWLNERPVASGWSLALATAARQLSSFFGVALVAQWGWNRLRKRPARDSAWIVAIIGASGILAFAVYAYLLSGDPKAILSVQSAWGREAMSASGLLRVGTQIFTSPTSGHFALGAFIVLGLYTLRRYGVMWGVLVLGPVVLAASTGTILSMRRIVLMSFAAAYPAAGLLRRPWTFWSVVCLEGALQLFFLWRYVHGIWVA